MAERRTTKTNPVLLSLRIPKSHPSFPFSPLFKRAAHNTHRPSPPFCKSWYVPWNSHFYFPSFSFCYFSFCYLIPFARGCVCSCFCLGDDGKLVWGLVFGVIRGLLCLIGLVSFLCFFSTVSCVIVSLSSFVSGTGRPLYACMSLSCDRLSLTSIIISFQSLSRLALFSVILYWFYFSFCFVSAPGLAVRTGKNELFVSVFALWFLSFVCVQYFCASLCVQYWSFLIIFLDFLWTCFCLGLLIDHRPFLFGFGRIL